MLTIQHLWNVTRQKLTCLVEAPRSSKWEKLEREWKATHPNCVACGTNKNVQVHHCIPFDLRPDLELDKTNLISLCMNVGMDCHLMVGHGGDFHSYNKSVRIDAVHVMHAVAAHNMSRVQKLFQMIKESRLSMKGETNVQNNSL